MSGNSADAALIALYSLHGKAGGLCRAGNEMQSTVRQDLFPGRLTDNSLPCKNRPCQLQRLIPQINFRRFSGKHRLLFVQFKCQISPNTSQAAAMQLLFNFQP